MRTGETRPPHRSGSKRAPRKSSEPLVNRLPLQLSRQDLPTPTTTSKDEPCCPCWDLHQAAAAREGAEAVRRYLVSGGDPGVEQWGNTSLHVAAHEGREDVVGVLLSYKADVDRRNRAGETALHLACRQGRTRVVRLLLEKCADPRSADICGRVPHDVLCTDHEPRGQIIDLLEKSEALRELGSLKRRVHIQVCHNSTQAVEKLLEVGGSIDIRDAAQRTLLHRACEEANLGMVEKLLALGATVNATEKRGQTPLHRACERGRLDVVRMLVEKGGANTRARAKLKHEPLHVACLGNWGEVVRFLLAEGNADAEVPDKNGKTCLHLAVERNRLEAIRVLLRHGCDIEAVLPDGGTGPLHIACRRGFERAATLLLDCNANHAAPGPDGHSALHMAAKEGKAAIVELLIGRKANLHAKDHRGRTPLQFTNNRRCKERLREAERKEERAALEQRRQSEERERERALKRREEQILERLDLRSRARLAGGVR